MDEASTSYFGSAEAAGAGRGPDSGDRTLHTVADKLLLYPVQKAGRNRWGVTMTVAMIRPLQRPVPLRQSVYDALIDLIVGGELPPGQHMVETDLARQLGVSRQPIREALHRMEAEGWVDLRPSQGAFVHVPTDSEVDELLDVRALLEAETARLAAASAGSDPQARPAQLN